MSSGTHTVWTAIAGATYRPLLKLPQTPPPPLRAAELEAEAERELDSRLEAYRTPVTHETLRLRVP